MSITRIITTLLLVSFPLFAVRSNERSTVIYINGFWFDGNEFRDRDVAVIDGVLTSTLPGSASQTIDLEGRYVVSAFGDAHEHNFNSKKYIDEDIKIFLTSGTFYVMVQDAFAQPRHEILGRVNRQDSVDVVYTWAPIIGPRHGLIDFFTSLAKDSFYGDARTPEQLDGIAFILLNNEQDLNQKWDRIATSNADFIKVILAFSEENELRRNNESFYTNQDRNMARPGIPPSLLDEIVKRAHSIAKRVSVHVETAADFRLATKAGADIIAHLPGWHIGPTAGFADSSLDHWLISDEDARIAAEHKVTVITTTYPKSFLDNAKLSDSFARVHHKNLDTLKKQKVNIAIGADHGQFTGVDETLHLAKFGVFTKAELLKMLSETTPRLIFPKQKIGCLDDGCEANFLVLENNPIQDLNALKTINRRVKAGKDLTLVKQGAIK